MPCSLCQPETTEPAQPDCPDCGSFPEDRAFARFFREFARPESGAKILDVAPPAPQLAYFPQERFLGGARYTAIAPVRLPEADSVKLPHRFIEMDITHLSFSDASFDMIICNHVLNYVRSDFLAMSELHRCLKARGMAFLNVSMMPGKSRRAGEGTGSPGSGREWRYGDDYFERLEAAGLFVLRLPLKALLKNFPEAGALPEDAQQVICFKFRDAMEAFRSGLSR
ncbi:MAG TPA: class I SAM-dependent methyltransferase [Bdellovibrionota bacterium]|jgi:SAM-dependent methyltransferase